jgi:preprotein translocase subunit SecE
VAEQEDDEFEGMQDDAVASELEAESAAEVASETPGDRAAARTTPTQPRRDRARAAAAPHSAGPLERAGSFWRDVRAELKRVTWPTLPEVQKTTIITIIAVIFFATYLWGVDHLLAFVITQLESVANRLFG